MGDLPETGITIELFVDWCRRNGVELPDAYDLAERMKAQWPALRRTSLKRPHRARTPEPQLLPARGSCTPERSGDDT